MIASVLVYTPTYENRMRAETVETVEGQRTAFRWEWVVDDDNPFPGRDMRNVNSKYCKAQQMALEGGYDALVTVEHDMVLPDGCLQTLQDTPAPVVYSAYLLRHGQPVLSLFRKDGKKNVGMSLSLHLRDLKAMRAQGYGEVSGVGWGCTLIRRSVLERIPFTMQDQHANDIPFAKDCLRAGILQMGRLDVACGHITENGVVLEPWMASKEWRCIAIQDVTASIGGSGQRLESGQSYDIPIEEARELERAGYVRIVDETADDDASGRETAEAPVAQRKAKPKRRTRKRRAASGDTD